MAWDFQADPEFQEQLDWATQFVREEIWPIEPVADELDQSALERIYTPLQEQVKVRGLWAAHLDPELGGQVLDGIRAELGAKGPQRARNGSGKPNRLRVSNHYASFGSASSMTNAA